MRRQALDIFVNRIASHHELQQSEDLRTFLQADEQVWWLKEDNIIPFATMYFGKWSSPWFLFVKILQVPFVSTTLGIILKDEIFTHQIGSKRFRTKLFLMEKVLRVHRLHVPSTVSYFTCDWKKSFLPGARFHLSCTESTQIDPVFTTNL